MNVNGKAKDKMKARMDISLFCHCKNMELVMMGNRSQSKKATSPYTRMHIYFSTMA
jgi:hypothetical protein